MQIIISLFLFGLGLLALIKSSSILVDGASSIAKKYKISPLVIGLTIVAFGTSAPELLVSVTSALSGSTDIALGNVIGSNIFNVLVILGTSALIYPMSIKRSTVWKEIPFSLLAAVLVLLLAAGVFINHGLRIDLTSTEIIGNLTRNYGFILLSIFIIFLVYVFGITKNSKEENELIIKNYSMPVSILMIVVGLIGLSLSAKFLVTDSAIQIARYLNVSENLIGLTLVAAGTSLPELATSIVAALKKNSDIAIGNIVGSNIFNILFILGVTLLISPVPISGQNIFDILFLVFTTLILFFLVFVFQKYRLKKIEGILMLGLYFIYLGYLITR